jgi:hypothetical protein
MNSFAGSMTDEEPIEMATVIPITNSIQSRRGAAKAAYSTRLATTVSAGTYGYVSFYGCEAAARFVILPNGDNQKVPDVY